MSKRNALMGISAVVLFLLLVPATIAQQNAVEYNITRATADSDNPNDIDVQFGSKQPSDDERRNRNNWIIRRVEFANPDNKTDKLVISSIDTALLGVTTLKMQESVDPARFKYVIIFKQGNFPLATLNQPAKTGAKKHFTAANGKSDADIYISGSAAAARKSGPIYSVETKLGYLHDLGDAGELGGRFELAADEGSDVDPDSILATATYKKVFPAGRGAGIILKSDFIGGEFDRKNKNRNLVTGLDLIFVPRSKLIGETNFAAIRFLTGLEAGHNFKNSITPQGIGNFWRPKFGVNGYFVALNPPLFNRINLSAEYKVRLPRSAEPFTDKINGTSQTFLTKKPRHYVGADLDLLFAPTYGLSLKYRYGSLPPAFKLVDNKVSIGLTFLLKQVN